jgi:hypothetical protein
MTKLQLARIRQRVRGLKARRTALEYIAMRPETMVAASLIERRLTPGGSLTHYLSIPTPKNSWHRYVRKDELAKFRRQAGAWREYVNAMAEWVRVNREIESELRRLGRGRCEKLEIRRGNKR